MNHRTTITTTVRGAGCPESTERRFCGIPMTFEVVVATDDNTRARVSIAVNPDGSITVDTVDVR